MLVITMLKIALNINLKTPPVGSLFWPASSWDLAPLFLSQAAKLGFATLEGVGFDYVDGECWLHGVSKGTGERKGEHWDGFGQPMKVGAAEHDLELPEGETWEYEVHRAMRAWASFDIA